MFNTMKSFCPYSQCSHLNILTFFSPDRVDAQNHRGLGALRFFFVKVIILSRIELTNPHYYIIPGSCEAMRFYQVLHSGYS